MCIILNFWMLLQTDVFSLETAFLYDLKQVWIAQDAKTKGTCDVT